jgi:hypothetical protein
MESEESMRCSFCWGMREKEIDNFQFLELKMNLKKENCFMGELSKLPNFVIYQNIIIYRHMSHMAYAFLVGVNRKSAKSKVSEHLSDILLGFFEVKDDVTFGVC